MRQGGGADGVGSPSTQNFFQRLFQQPLYREERDYGSLHDEDETDSEMDEEDTEWESSNQDHSFVGVDQPEEEDDEPGILEVKVIRAMDLPPDAVKTVSPKPLLPYVFPYSFLCTHGPRSRPARMHKQGPPPSHLSP